MQDYIWWRSLPSKDIGNFVLILRCLLEQKLDSDSLFLYYEIQRDDQNIGLDDRLQMLCKLYEQKIPFNKVLGLKVESLKIEDVRVKFKMKNWIKDAQ